MDPFRAITILSRRQFIASAVSTAFADQIVPAIADNAALPASISNVTNAPGGAIILGRGYYSINGALVAPALSSVPANQPNTGYHQRGVLVHITDEEQLFKETDISAGGSFHYGMFSASASYNFNASSKYSKFHNYLLAKVFVEQEPQTLNDYHLTDDALSLTTNGSAEAFYGTFGDSFVSDITLGGYLYALITFTTTTKAEYEANAASLNFGVLNFGGADVQFLSKLASYSAYTNTVINVIKNGGSTQSFPDVTTLVQEFQSFPAQVSAPGSTKVVTAYRTLDYSKTTNKPTGIKFLNVDTAVQALKTLSGKTSSINRWQGDLSFLRDHPEQFDPYNRQTIESELARLNTEQSSINQIAGQIISDPFDVPALPDVDLSFLSPLPAWHGTVPIVVRINYPSWNWTPNDQNFSSDQWAGTTEGAPPASPTYRGIYALALSFKNPIPGLNLNYEITNSSGHTATGSNGQLVNPNPNNVATGNWIVKIRIWLSGPGAQVYRVSYCGWKIFSGKTALSEDGGPCVADSGLFACINCSPAQTAVRMAGKQFSALWVDIRGRNETVPVP